MWFLPTRSIPESLYRFFKAYKETQASTPGTVRLDLDDPLIEEYLSLEKPDNWVISAGKRLRFDKMYNEFYANHPDLEWYGFVADDVVPLTSGWDLRLIELAGKDGLSYPNDNLKGESHAAHFVLGGDLVREVGFLLLPGLDRLYGDTVWNDIAREKNVLRYAEDVVLEHLHFSNGKSPFDETCVKNSASDDYWIYQAWKKMGNLTCPSM